MGVYLTSMHLPSARCCCSRCRLGVSPCRNYFSVGADAQAAYNFHHLRDTHPALASNRLANQFWYSAFSCTSGWFCGTIPSVSNFTQVEVMRPGDSEWTPLAVPPSIKALVLVNLQSYGGGRNIWGEKPPKRPGKWRDPSVSDGLLEVGGWVNGPVGVGGCCAAEGLCQGFGVFAGVVLELPDGLAAITPCISECKVDDSVPVGLHW